MSTTFLESAIDSACTDLNWISQAIAKVGSTRTLSQESYNFFELSDLLADQLEHAKALVSVREIALNAVIAFPTQVSSTSSGRFSYHGADVMFKQGRYLVLQNYATTTWALYDALAKVAGILCCSDEFARNKQVPVKLYEHFLKGKICVGARVQEHLKGAYGWPIAVSYKIRNWLVHDGHSHEGVELFKYDSPAVGAEFELSDDAWKVLENLCSPELGRSRLQPFPDLKTNLTQGLETCHQEVDEAVGFLLAWSAGVAMLQAKILLPRDMNSGTPIPPAVPISKS